MRIVVLTEHHCKDTFGGAEYRLGLIAQDLAKSGHHVYYVCTSPDAREWSSEAVHIIPLKARTFSRRFGSNYFLYRSDIFKALDRIRPDIIYQSVACAFTGVAASYAKKNGCRMVWHIASERDVRPGRLTSFRTALFDCIDRRWTEYGIRSADLIIGQARYQDQLLQKNYGRNCDLIVGTPHPAPTETIAKAGGPLTVVWIANLKPLKQPDVFLRLAGEFGEHRDWRFVMIGRPASGHYQRNLEKEMVRLRNFSYMGECPIEEVNRILARSHVLVNTSLYEGFPNTFIQAWFRHVPVVSLNVDPDDILKENGIGFHSRSFEGLVRDTDRLIRDRELRESMGRRAHEYALRRHSMGPNIAKVISFLKGVG
jgi:glycosyltransferase involved in cell wall biosynthesis